MRWSVVFVIVWTLLMPRSGAAQSAHDVSSLATLSSRVGPADHVAVDAVGGPFEGTFVSASDQTLTVNVDGRVRDVPAADVRRVWKRGGRPVLHHMGVGWMLAAGLGAVIGTVSDNNRAEGAILGAAYFSSFGLMGGALAGVLTHKRILVYDAAARHVAAVPAIGPPDAASRWR